MNKIIISPINPDGEAIKIDVFNTSQICNAYKTIGIDVNRFFKNLDEVKLFECQTTGYRFYHPYQTIGDAEFYKDLCLTRENYYPTRWEHKKILNDISQNEKVLEIGSGFGTFLKLLEEKNVEAEGIELNPQAIKVCQDEGLKIHNCLIDEFALKHENHFDIVCSFQVLEHITNVHEFISDSLKVLKPDGKLIFGIPNNNPFLFVNDKYHTLNLPPHHAGLWNKKALESLTKLFNLKLDTISFEPLANNYSQFIKTYVENSNALKKVTLKVFRKICPTLLEKVMCKLIKGRNILVIYKKSNA